MAHEPWANIIAHPFYYPGGCVLHREILSRISDAQFYDIFTAMREDGKAAEITAYQFFPVTRDIEHTRRMYSIAKDRGVKFVLDSDAHDISQVGDGYRCIPVLSELGFTQADFVDYKELISQKRK